MSSREEDLIKKDTNLTLRVGATMVIALLVQTAGVVWWAATVDAKIDTNEQAISSLSARIEKADGIIISREQLEDILGVRDQRLDRLEKTTQNIEHKIDVLLQK